MATYDASVKKALTASQRDLIDHKEHCSADPVKLATVGRERGHQVRIKRSDSEYGLYMVSQVRRRLILDNGPLNSSGQIGSINIRTSSWLSVRGTRNECWHLHVNLCKARSQCLPCSRK
jgi:hypothetical protein